MLILKTLSLGPMHGWGIRRRIHLVSDEVFRVEEGSPYPALFMRRRIDDAILREEIRG